MSYYDDNYRVFQSWEVNLKMQSSFSMNCYDRVAMSYLGITKIRGFQPSLFTGQDLKLSDFDTFLKTLLIHPFNQEG